MDAARQARRREKEKLLAQLAELTVEEQVEQGVFLETPHYSIIELTARQLGRELSRRTQQRATREVAAKCPGEAGCPACGSPCCVEMGPRDEGTHGPQLPSSFKIPETVANIAEKPLPHVDPSDQQQQSERVVYEGPRRVLRTALSSMACSDDFGPMAGARPRAADSTTRRCVHLWETA